MRKPIKPRMINIKSKWWDSQVDFADSFGDSISEIDLPRKDKILGMYNNAEMKIFAIKIVSNENCPLICKGFALARLKWKNPFDRNIKLANGIPTKNKPKITDMMLITR